MTAGEIPHPPTGRFIWKGIAAGEEREAPSGVPYGGRRVSQWPRLETFSTRLAALSRVQGVISEADGDQVQLREVVRREVQALGEIAVDRVTVQGQDVSLPIEHIQTLGLALHELATNAVKHGALKEQAGHLDITWTIERSQQGEKLWVLNWHEIGLSAPPDSSRRGFRATPD